MAEASATSAPTSRTARGGVAASNARRGAGLLVALAVLVVAVLASIAVGSRQIPVPVVLDALFSYDPSVDDHVVVWQLRVPRTVVGLAVGLALGAAGALVQALTRNPLAEPGLLGVNAGAAFAVALGVAVFGVTRVEASVWFAFGGALAVTVAVYLIGSTGRGGADPVRLVLAGVALGAVLQGVTTGLVLLDPRAFDQLRAWNAGSLVGRDLDLLLGVLPYLAVGVVVALLAARPLDAIALGEDLAAAVGAPVAVTRVGVVLAVTLLAGGATALAGPISFVGLMVPHVARWVVGPDQRWILAYVLVLAPVLLLGSDVLGRVLMSPGEVPVGIVTAFVGAPVLVLLVRRHRASGL
ncbi:iron chelate uptake ABC transporter family permease subunit [Pseudokineococcus sp. 1T1Z-3]|uniref:iron chelate uptake ABC transporter family permease subunit n=1 Tax=Pseudokineococcus sp. 1T1Z-3 TaxID=3132745 RepID=UPI0030B31F2D